MKHTLLATTALVALTGAAAAEITISGTARLGMVTTEGAAATAAKAAGTTYGKFNAANIATLAQFGKSTAAYVGQLTVREYAASGAAVAMASTTAGDAAIAGDIVKIKAMIEVAKSQLAGTYDMPAINAGAAVTLAEQTAYDTAREANDALVDTAAERAVITGDIAALEAILAELDVSASAAAVAKKSDTTVGKNRVRISFAGSGTTDGGLTYGFSARADHSNTSTGGSQYISGAFGKISMGDLNGGDEQLVGNLSGVGSSGAGSHQEFGYQSSSHNIGYSVSMAGVSFAATTDLVRGADATKTGSNSAYGVKWSGDMGGATISAAIGTSKIGTVSEDSMSVGVSMGGLSIKAVSHTNDNGPATALKAGTAANATTAVYVADVAATTTPDTDTTGLSISYAMDAMSVTAYTRTESTSGAVDKDYSGVGFTYNLGGATVKAGFVDANDISVMDFGINFSF
jgi:outer membrane protein OmpU